MLQSQISDLHIRVNPRLTISALLIQLSYQRPKRARYSSELMNALTISA